MTSLYKKKKPLTIIILVCSRQFLKLKYFHYVRFEDSIVIPNTISFIICEEESS